MANIWNKIGQDINSDITGDSIGSAISLNSDGSIMAIGYKRFASAPNDLSGRVKVFINNGTAWDQRGSTISGEAAYDYFGHSVSLSSDGNTLAIGAIYNDGNNGSDSGHTRIYDWNGSDWAQRGSDIDGEAANDWSGHSVSLSSDGNTVAIGANKNDGNSGNNGSDSGHTRIYDWNGSDWAQRGSDIDGTESDQSGYSVSLSSDGNTVAIGTFSLGIGYAIIYYWNGSAWDQRGSTIEGQVINDQFGHSVSLSSDGNTIAVGAYYAGPAYEGHTRIYDWDGNAWNQRGSDIQGEAAGDQSGYSVSLSSDGNTVAIGAIFNDGNGDKAGHTRIYYWDGSAWAQRGSDIDGAEAGDWAGYSVSLSSDGDTVAIGARDVTATGYVRVYNYDTTAPVITITGDNPLTIQKDSTYTELGATTDDGSAVVTSGSVNTTISGTYTITYTSTDSSGNQSTATRTVIVEDTEISSSSGDPYVTTLCGNKFKLPDATRIYRMVQFTDSKNKDLIINASVSQLTVDEIKHLEDTAKSFINSTPVTNGYFYESFYISYGSKYVVFDRHINLIDTNIFDENDIQTKDITIKYETEVRPFSCPIQGNTTSTDTVITIGNSVIRLQKINHPQIINGIEFSTTKTNSKMVVGILNTYYHPKNYTIKKLNSKKIINSNITKKIYKKSVKETWVGV